MIIRKNVKLDARFIWIIINRFTSKRPYLLICGFLNSIFSPNLMKNWKTKNYWKWKNSLKII